MTPEQRREQAEKSVVMEEKTDVPKLADVLDDVRVKVCIGLEQQGHIPTVEKMLAEGKTWEEIGEVIGWYGPTAEEWYGLYLKAREESQAPPASPAQLSARAWIELDEPFQAQFRKDHPHWFSTAIDDACKFAEAYRDASQRQPSEQHTICARCGEDKPTPLRRDDMGGYVCLTCVDSELSTLRAQLTAVHGYLSRLFIQIAPRCTQDGNPLTLCTQIDNYIAGQRGELEAAEAKIAELEAQRQPQSVSEEQLQKALGELSLALGNPALEFGDEGIEVALIRFAAQSLTKSAFKEEL